MLPIRLHKGKNMLPIWLLLMLVKWHLKWQICTKLYKCPKMVLTILMLNFQKMPYVRNTMIV